MAPQLSIAVNRTSFSSRMWRCRVLSTEKVRLDLSLTYVRASDESIGTWWPWGSAADVEGLLRIGVLGRPIAYLPPASTGLTSTMGVPSKASSLRTSTRSPSITAMRTRCSPIGFGLSWDRVLNTPVSVLGNSSPLGLNHAPPCTFIYSGLQ